MKIRILLLICILLSACGKAKHGGKSELTALYEELDAEIDKSSEYENIKESRMARLRKAYDMTNDSRQRTDIINRIIAEFDAYNADSALYYVSYNLHRPDVKTIPGEYTRLMIKRADIFAHAGLFADALAIMQNIPRDSLTPSLLEAYYSTYCATYQYLSEYTDEHETALEYAHHRTLYSDSLNRVISPDSFNHLVYVLSQKAREGNTQEAIEALSQHLSDYLSGTREYSILASTLAYIYKTAGYKDEYKRHLVLSAISDVRGAVKENMSFREVATVMFEDGDVERANRYLKKSIADANFYSAMMRNAQSSKMLPVIDEAYTSMQNRLTGRLRIMVWISSILSVFLILTLVFLLRQYKSLHKANERVSLANEELSAMSQLLRETNAELEHRNNELHEYNRTKEQYAGLFMEYCSTAISTLQHYQQSLRVLAAQGGNRAALMKKLESSETGDGLLRNFYGRFDEAILNIYPSFVDKFNTLLKPEERVVLKSGELLNTELRLFALIRIGIDDSNQIAQFLRCSISTVYTYRSKMKKRALNPSDFESEVRNIT
ncbi:MAG: hypothetical protein K2J29_02920 [Muribaculaceae bacterium]|nr:hypothetical protein [Bacteroides sp.]MDE6803570.1 hypothetical protein [Muribaculaceae bacterium]MDE6843843.1 hypothetical protein [Muribaculaceae bacterium]